VNYHPDVGELVGVVSRLLAPALALVPTPGRPSRQATREARREAARRLREGIALLERHPVVRERLGRRFGGELDALLERAARAVREPAAA
jgi:hypothetical protein